MKVNSESGKFLMIYLHRQENIDLLTFEYFMYILCKSNQSWPHLEMGECVG